MLENAKDTRKEEQHVLHFNNAQQLFYFVKVKRNMKILNNYVVECSGELDNSQIIDDNDYQFPVNSFITDITVSIEPKNAGEPIFYNVEQTNCIQVRNSYSHYQAIYIPKGCYELDQLTALLNDNLVAYDVTIDIITSGENYGKAKITLLLDGLLPDIKFEAAPDIMRIYQFNQEYYKGTYISNNVVDITSGLQNLSIYSPIVRGAIQSVMHSKNNLLCTMQITNITGPNTQHFNNVFIPVQRYSSHTPFIVVSTETNSRVTFNARMIIHMNVSVIQPHLKTDNVDDVIQTDLYNSMKLLFPVQSAEQTFDFTNTVMLPPNSYITRVTVLSDAEISNITSDNVVVVDGQNLTFKHGTYDLDKFMSILAESTATFNLIMSGENTYKMKIEDFQTIDFTNAQEVKNILGFTNDILKCRTYKKVFDYTTNNNTMSITTNNKTYSKSIPTGNYTEDEFLYALAKYIFKSIDNFYYIDYFNLTHYYEFFTKRQFTVNSTTLNGWYTSNNEGKTSLTRTTFILKKDTTIKAQFLDNAYPTATGIIPAGNYKIETLLQAVRQIVNSTGAGWFFRDTFIQRNNNNAPTVYLTGIDKLPIIGNVLNGYATQYKWAAYSYRIPKLGHAYIPAVTYQLQGAHEYFYLQSALTIRYSCQEGKKDIIIKKGKQSVFAILDGIVAAANSLKANSMTYSKNDKGVATVSYNVTDYTVTIRANNTDVSDLLFTYFGIPTRLTSQKGTFTFASPFNQDFYLYTPTDSVTIPQGTQFTYTQSQTGESTTTTFTFTEDFTTDSIGEILTYIDTTFLIPTYNKAGDTNSLLQYIETPLGTKLTKHNLANGAFGRSTTSTIQLLDILTLNSTNVFFCKKPTIKIPAQWQSPHTYPTATNGLYTQLNNMTEHTALCKDYTVTQTADCINIRHTNTELSLLYTTNNFIRKIEDANNIKLIFEMKPYICYVDKPLTITAGNQTKTINFNKSVTQEEIINAMNDAFFNMNIPISWKIQPTCYSIVANQSFTLSGQFDTVNLPQHIIPFNESTQVVTYNFFDNSKQRATAGVEDIISDKVINLTNNKEVAKIYCDLVKSWWGCNSLLTTLHITDLHKNYYSDIELIPCDTSFNTVNFKIQDLADNPYSFNGTIYVELELSNTL